MRMTGSSLFMNALDVELSRLRPRDLLDRLVFEDSLYDLQL